MKSMKTPKKLDIAITNRCNLRCGYCYHFGSDGDVGNDLPIEEWIRFFEELNRCAVMSLTLSGGEPFLRADLREILDGVVRNRMRFSILSNGTLITDDLAAYLASTRRCDYVQVSIDGSRAESHDAFRGSGNFERAVRGIRILQRYGVPVAVRVTIHRENVGDLEGAARFLLDDLGVPGIGTNAAGPVGLCRSNAERIRLSAGDRTVAMETLLRLSKRYGGRITALAGPLAEARSWLEMEQARREGRAAMPRRGALTGCGCTHSQMAVRADGVMVPCTFLSQIKLGRINRDGLREIWQEHEALRALRQRHLIPLSAFEFCRGCEYIPYCTGNCPGMSYSMVGEVNHPSPDACLRTFLSDGGKLPEPPLLEGPTCPG